MKNQPIKYELNQNTNILIVGLGVIGGGYAKALTKRGYTVRCITKHRSDVDYALANGMIASGSTEVEAELVGSADLIVFALYPQVFIDWIGQYQHLFKSGALITDVTGIRTRVAEDPVSCVAVGTGESLEHLSAIPEGSVNFSRLR